MSRSPVEILRETKTIALDCDEVFGVPCVASLAEIEEAAHGRGGRCREGPERFSLDRLIGWDGSISGLWWSVGVLALAAAISAATLASRRVAKASLREVQRPQHEHRAA